MTVRDYLAAAGIVLAGFSSLFLLFCCFSALLAAILFRFAVHRRRRRKTGTHSAGLEPFDPMIREGITWADGQSFETVHIRSRDGLTLAGRFLPGDDPKKAVLMMHGYLADTMYEFSCGMRYFHEQGYNVLLPAQRAHDESEGDYIGFGVLERYDVQRWCCYLTQRLGADCRILLHGISMGGATVLMASDLPMPPSVAGIIADCAFTSPQAIMNCVLRRDMHLYGFSILPAARFMSRRFAKFDTTYSAVDSVRHSRLPILFIHGSADEMVPLEMTLESYRECVSPKRLMVVPGAMHGCSFFTNPEIYARAVEDFAHLCHVT